MEEACNSFRTYLNSSGIGEALETTLTALFQMKTWPANPMEFIRQNLPPAQNETTASLSAELIDLRKDIENLRKMMPKEDPLPLPDIIEEPKHEDGTEQTEIEAQLEELELKMESTTERKGQQHTLAVEEPEETKKTADPVITPENGLGPEDFSPSTDTTE